MLKQSWLHRKQNPLSCALVSLTWLFIYWTHTFPKSSCSLHRKLCHAVTLLLKGYFALSLLLVSDFLLFKVLFWCSRKKFKVLGSQILESWVLGLESQVLGPYFKLCHNKKTNLKGVYSWNKMWSLKSLVMLKCESRWSKPFNTKRF